MGGLKWLGWWNGRDWVWDDAGMGVIGCGVMVECNCIQLIFRFWLFFMRLIDNALAILS